MKIRYFLLIVLALAALPCVAGAISLFGPHGSSGTAPTQSILSVTASPGSPSFPAGSVDGTVVASISTVMSPSSPPFSGAYSVAGTNSGSFRIVGSNLVTNGIQSQASYSIRLTATPSGGLIAPFTTAPITITTPGQVVSDIGLSSLSFTAGSSSGTTVGTLSAIMSPSSPGFSGSFLAPSGPDGASFQVSGTSLQTNGVLCASSPPCTYNITLTAAPSAAIVPFSKNFTITAPATSSQAIASASLPANVFGAVAGNANTPFGTFAFVMSPVSPSANVRCNAGPLGGADGSLFVVNAGCQVSVGSSDVTTVRNYTVTVTATQSFPPVTNSPFTSGPITIQGVTGPTITVDNLTPTAGSNVTVTVTNSPNPVGGDWVEMAMGDIHGNTHPGPSNVGGERELGAGVHNTTQIWRIPVAPSDTELRLKFILRADTFFWRAYTPDMIIPPTITYSPPTATNTLTAPFTPLHTITVCPSGCNFTNPATAVASATQDFTLITVQAGVYNQCIVLGQAAAGTGMHLWIKGVGGDFAWFRNTPACQSKGAFIFGGDTAGDSLLVLDNIRISEWQPGGSVTAGLNVVDGGTIWLRNVYISDGVNGILSGPRRNKFLIQNSHFARNGVFGGYHNMYIGEGVEGYPGTLILQNSIIEQAMAGHEVKTRMPDSTITCNIIKGSLDDIYIDSILLDQSEGRVSHVYNNTFIKGQGGTLGHSTQSNIFGYGLDRESPVLPDNYMDIHDNWIINDDFTLREAEFFTIYQRMAPSPPYTFPASNKLIGPVNPEYGGKKIYFETGLQPKYDGRPSDVIDLMPLYADRAAAGIAGVQVPNPPLGGCGTIGNMAIP